MCSFFLSFSRCYFFPGARRSNTLAIQGPRSNARTKRARGEYYVSFPLNRWRISRVTVKVNSGLSAEANNQSNFRVTHLRLKKSFDFVNCASLIHWNSKIEWVFNRDSYKNRWIGYWVRPFKCKKCPLWINKKVISQNSNLSQ